MTTLDVLRAVPEDQVARIAHRLMLRTTPATGRELAEACAREGISPHAAAIRLLSAPEPYIAPLVTSLAGTRIQKIPLGECAIDPLTGRLRATPAQRPPGARAPRRTHDPRIVISVAPNPKREGSLAHRRYAHWRVGETVSACLEAGLTQADVRWDVERGYVRLTMPQ